MEQSDEEDEQYDSQVGTLPEMTATSAATGLVHAPLGMYMPASLQVAVQVRVLDSSKRKMSSPKPGASVDLHEVKPVPDTVAVDWYM